MAAEATFIGPAFVGYSLSFREPSPEPMRFAQVASPEFDDLRAALSPQEWQYANLEAKSPVFGASVAGSIVAAAGAEILLGTVAHIGVATHPAHRGRGLARGVVSAAACSALAAGLLPQFQTLLSNRAALTVGRALGFEQFATTLVCRWGGAAA